VWVQDENGNASPAPHLPDGEEGIARFHDLVGGHVDEPGAVVIGIETDRGLLVAALVAKGDLASP
jgi:hypothetical protein